MQLLFSTRTYTNTIRTHNTYTTRTYDARTHARTHVRTHARTHDARTYARTYARTHARTHLLYFFVLALVDAPIFSFLSLFHPTISIFLDSSDSVCLARVVGRAREQTTNERMRTGMFVSVLVLASRSLCFVYSACNECRPDIYCKYGWLIKRRCQFRNF